MDDNGSAYNFIQSKSFIIKGGPGVALISHKRQQVAGMIRVGGLPGIVMVSCMLEVVSTVA